MIQGKTRNKKPRVYKSLGLLFLMVGSCWAVDKPKVRTITLELVRKYQRENQPWVLAPCAAESVLLWVYTSTAQIPDGYFAISNSQYRKSLFKEYRNDCELTYTNNFVQDLMESARLKNSAYIHFKSVPRTSTIRVTIYPDLIPKSVLDPPSYWHPFW